MRLARLIIICWTVSSNIPIKVRTLVRDLYTDFLTAIAFDAFLTDFILVGKGVLQGNCLSPLAFNMIINTFIQFIKSEKYQQFGYNFIKYMIPRHWYQFADDAAVVTGLEHENQVLLNAFNSWCTWADMVIRVDKCHSFGMKKVCLSSRQYKPKLYINNELIPSIDINESFKYLGRHFDYSMSNQVHKDNLCDTVDELLKDIDSLSLHPRNKLLIYHHYLLSKISWDLTIADVSMTWIKQTLDNKVSDYIRRWLEMPISGTLDVISLSKQKCGLRFINVSS